MSRESVPSQIGKAWQSHREGRHAEAIAEFNRILKEAPESVDAYYGLALAQRADSQHEAAIKTFQKALALAKEAASKFGVAQEEVETQNREDNLLRSSGQDDRYMMLRRMIRQRLTELNATPEG